MYRTKKDVDKHVQDINSKIRNASDRNLKGYSIAKLYHQVGDYENARRYVTNYLSEKDTSVVAHKLLAQIYEALKQKDKAVGSYKKAYELDNTQKDLVLKICELLVDLPIDPQRAKYWVETGEKHHPHHDSVYRLREAMLTSVEGDTSPKLEEVLAAELVAKPTDVVLRMRMVRLFQRSGRILEGWEHVTQVENRMPWPENKDWYNCIAELAENFQLQFRTKCGHQFYIEYISCLDRLMDLEFRTGATASAAAEIMHKLDQVLHAAHQLPASGQPQVWPALMAHFRGQLYLHAATLLFRRSQKEVSAWKENSKFAGALLLASWGIREIDTSREDGRRMLYWKGSGSSRRSQAGHILLGMSGKQGASVYQERLAGLATTNTQDKIYNSVFVSRDQRAGSVTSCLASNEAFVELVARTSLPSLSDLASSDEAMAALKPDDLHHLVWVGLRYYRPGKVLELGFRLPGIDGLSQEGGKDPLSQLDMDAFLYATVYVTGWQVENEPSGQDVPPALSVAITAPLASEAQEEMWRVAIKSSREGLLPQERRVLQHGLDTIRAVGLHGLDLHLSMKLAKTFEYHALEAKAIADCDEHMSRDVEVLETRAATYYKCALSTIDKQDRGMGGRQPSLRLFSPAGGEPTSADVTKIKEGAKFFLACQKMHQGLHEEALTAFGELRTPYASFYTAEIYKKLAAEELNNRPGQIQGGVSGRYASLLHEAQEALYRTLDRLKAPGESAGHPLNQQLPECIEEVENLLAGVGVHGEEDVVKSAVGTPKRMVGVTRLEEELTSTPNMARSLFGNQNSSYVNSPGRTEARPSPERLDAQVRNLAATQEGVMKTLMEQNAVFVESNKAMLVELKNLNVEITKLRKSSEANEIEIRTLRKSSEVAADKAAEATTAAAKAAEASAAALVANASQQSTASSVAAATAAANMQAVNMHQQLNNMQAQAQAHVTGMENYQFTEEEQQLLDSFGYCTNMQQQQYGMYGQMSPFAQQMYSGAQMSQQQQLAKAVAMRSAAQQQQQQVQQQQAYAGMYSPQAWTGSPAQQPQANLQLPTVPTSVTPNSFSQHLSTQQKNTLFAQMGSKPSQTSTPSNTPQEGTSLVATPLASGQVTPTQAISKPALAKTSVPAANVVITKSDKIPTTAAPTTVTMSVTVPPQHRLGTTPRPTPTTQLLTTPTLAQSPATPISAYKTPAGTGPINALTGTPHGFQIPMPDGVSPLTVSPFPPEGGAACPITTTALLSTIAPPAFSAVTPSPDKSSASKLRNPSGGGTPTLKQRQPSATDDGEDEEYEPDVNFKPVIPLPEIVDVVTGEEDETILFEERSKLFRYAEDTKEWKERGLGQSKLLHNKLTGNVRFIMRREQTFKICANHNIVPEMKMDQMKGNAKARIWGADDFADEGKKTETFCIRFKTEEQAEEFNAKFEMAKTMAKAMKEKSPAKPKKSETEAKSSTLAQIAAKQKSSSWECSQCLVRNDMGKIQCMSCESAKPGHEEEVKKLQDANKPAAPVMTIGAGGGFKFTAAAEATAAPASGFMFGSTTTKPITTQTTTTSSTSGTGFTFGNVGTKTTESEKPVTKLGGFSFTNDPVVQNEETKEIAKPKVMAEVKTVESTKPSPFSGFTFSPKVDASSKLGPFGSTVESISTPAKSADAADCKTDLFGGKGASGLSTFGNLASGSSEGIKSDPDFKGFAGTGAQVFGRQTKKDANKTEDDDGAEEEYEPDVHFKPVIPLPELIEVKTGEEGETKLFCERVKLYRFVQETKEWKERGIGEFKILKNEETGKVRLLMRREQVHKICCNHSLTPDLEFSPLQSSDKAWTWSAPDFSEGQIVNELFALKFKNVDMATNWIDTIKDCQKDLKDRPATSPTKAAEPTPATSARSSAPAGSLAQIAASQKSSSWECQLCLVRNDMGKIQCMSCESAKPGHEEEVKKLQDAAKPAAPVMTIGEGGGFKFQAAPAAAPASSGFVFGTPEKPKSETPTTGGFQFGTPKSTSGFSFVPTPTGAVTPTKENAANKWSFGSPEKKEFAFSGIKPPSPRKHLNSVVSETEEDDGLYKDDDEGDNLYFEPVIPLPDKVEVKTGEENEEVLYSHRAKLYRYIDNEWKERGVGDVKILKNNISKKIRLLMRRDQVLKICLNHYATEQLVSTFKEKDTKSWTWAAQDFSEGELTSMTFALRFKSPEITKDFKETLDQAVKGTDSTAVVFAKEAAPAVSASGSEKEKSKTPSASEKVVVLFDVADYSPPEHVDNEEEVSFHGQGLKLNTEDDAAGVAAKISTTKTMHVLTLSGNTVGIEAAKAIGKSLEGHTEFRRAQWKDMFTGRMKTEIPPALIHLSNGIMTAKARLVELDLSDNAFGPIGMEGIKTLLASPSCFSLKILKLNNTGCGVTGGKALAKTLLECYHKSKEIGHPLALEVFVLGRSRQENEGGKALAEVFKLMGSLKEVVMPQNGIYHDGLTALADAFSNNPNLRHLDMNDNTFTEKGARPMAKALAKLKNLEYLNLGDCLLKSAGVTLIARAIKNNHPNLKELILDSNEIRTKGVMEVIEAIADKENLEKLSVDVNQLGDEGVAKMKKRLTEIGKLDVLNDLEENQDPDSDEEDPDLEDDQETEATEASEPSKSEEVVPESTSNAKSTFTFNTPTSKSASTIFGGSPNTSVFGGNSSQSNIFGGSPSSTFKPSGNLFGSSPSKESIFGNSAVNSMVADSSADKNETGERKTSFLFGGVGGQLAASAATPSIFAAGATSSPFAAGVTSSPGNSLFGSQPATQEPSSTTTSSSVFGSGSNANFSFSSFGSVTAESTGLAKASDDFKFKGAGAAVFGSKATPKKEGEESDGEDAEEDAHDPHFEPIVPLPELVTVTTGEEDEEVVFKHRAKVYRFDSDTKQWKERGVGDIKILKHPQTLKYRVLLRRDQIHKIACNHLILADIELKPMSNSDTAWCWYAMDFSEDEVNGILEHLAVRFKHADTAKEFKAKFVECQEDIKSRKNSPTKDASGVTVERAVLSPSKKPEDENAEEEEDAEDDEEDDYGDDDYNDGETIMFQQQAFLSQKDDKSGEWVALGDVDLRILYDDDVYGARIVAEGPSGTEEEDATVCNHLIAMQTNLSDDLTWSALDFSIDPPNYRTFKAQFESDEATSEFRDMFAEGKDLAEQSEILEQPGGIEGDPQDFYYGVGGDDDGQDS